jgi:PAS domain S-box-containing protein
MDDEENIPNLKERIRELEKRVSDLKFDLKEIKNIHTEESKKLDFYKLIADYAYSWELWFNPSGGINYCSPSCFDLTGFTSNQIIAAEGLSELLVYEPDKQKFDEFLEQSIKQAQMNQSLDFRILTRTKQLRWCMINVRGVYDRKGKYLGIRASIQDISRLKRAMGQIQEMGAMKEVEDRNRQRLQSQLTAKDRDLVSFLLQLSTKNELISTLANKLKYIETDQPEKCRKQLNQLLEVLENNSRSQIEWPLIESQLDHIYPGFLNRLQLKHPALTFRDKKLCAYLKLGLTSKEISGLQNITSKSVEISRIRLRKKMKITGKIRLTDYLDQL